MHQNKFILLILIFLSLTISANSQNYTSCFQPGEVLIYDVSFLGIKLGTIKLESVGIVELNKKQTYYAKKYIN